MRPCQCQRSAPPPATTTRFNLSVDVEPHPMIEQFATTMLLSMLGELAADGLRAVHIAVTINGYQPDHDWLP